MDNVYGGNVHHIYAETELLLARLLIILSMARYSQTFIFSLFSYLSKVNIYKYKQNCTRQF
jgi:hypothetical protein